MNEKDLGNLKKQYLEAAGPIQKRIGELQARVNGLRGAEHFRMLRRIASLQDDLWTLTDGVRMIQDSMDGHTVF